MVESGCQGNLFVPQRGKDSTENIKQEDKENIRESPCCYSAYVDDKGWNWHHHVN